MSREETKAIVKEAVLETLTAMGFTVDEPNEMQKDLQHVRQWRVGCEATRAMTLKIFLTVTIPGAIYFLFDALKVTAVKMLHGG